jgi:putative ABC transport system permease protein
VNTVLNDLRFALRTFWKRPAFTIVAIVTCALGIGVNTAVFGVVNHVLLEPLSYPHADRLVKIAATGGRTGHTANLSRPDFRNLERSNRSFASLAAFDAGIGAVTITGLGEAERVRAVAVTGNFFTTLQAVPEAGRLCDPGEEYTNPNITVISYAYWQRHFGGDLASIGKTYSIGTQVSKIVGVLPASFRYPQPELLGDPDMYGPMPFSGAYFVRSSRNIRAIGRLKPGVTVALAQQDLASIAAGLERKFPADNYRIGVSARALVDAIVGDSKPVLWLASGATLCVLLIGCANLINLLLAKGFGRNRELAIRAALGAGRSRLIRQLLTETLLLTAAGGACAAVLGAWILRAIVIWGHNSLPRTDEITMDARGFAFSAVLSALVGIVVVSAPAFRVAKAGLDQSIRQSGRTDGQGLSRGIGHMLVGAEIAISIMLLVTAGLLVRSFWKLSHVDPGFDPRHVVTAQLSAPPSRYPQEKSVQFYRELFDRLRKLPGVRGVAATNILPLSGNHSCDLIRVDAHPMPPGQNPCAETRSVSEEYFRVMSIAIRRGRSFDARDNSSAARVVIVNEAMAQWLWAGEDPLGQTLTMVSLGSAEAPRTIVGIATSTVHANLSEAAVPQYYIPQAQQPFYSTMTLVLRGDDAFALIPSVRKEVAGMDPAIPLFNVRTFSELIDSSISRPRFQTLLFGAFGALALALACGGVYGVIAHTVSKRVYEFGVRACLGATRRDIAGC